MPIIESQWEPTLMKILAVRCKSKELVKLTCQIIEKALSILPETGWVLTKEFFDILSRSLMYCFHQNQQNLCCLATYTFLCEMIIQSNDKDLKALCMSHIDEITQQVLHIS